MVSRTGVLACLLAAGVLTGTQMSPAEAQEKPLGVVELFTSQGCSRCPPADKILADLADRGNIVALAYHVDYWDYLGWKDTLATAENTDRQRMYEDALGTSVYTPQAIVNGQYGVVGSDREALFSALKRGAEPFVPVELSSTADSTVIRIGEAVSNSVKKAHVVLVYYKPHATVTIRGGENRGRKIDYRNVVTRFQTVGMWDGTPMRLELPKSELEKKGGACAVLLQKVDGRGQPGKVLGAAKMETIAAP